MLLPTSCDRCCASIGHSIQNLLPVELPRAFAKLNRFRENVTSWKEEGRTVLNGVAGGYKSDGDRNEP